MLSGYFRLDLTSIDHCSLTLYQCVDAKSSTCVFTCSQLCGDSNHIPGTVYELHHNSPAEDRRTSDCHIWCSDPDSCQRPWRYSFCHMLHSCYQPLQECMSLVSFCPFRGFLRLIVDLTLFNFSVTPLFSTPISHPCWEAQSDETIAAF